MLKNSHDIKFSTAPLINHFVFNWKKKKKVFFIATPLY